MFHLLVFVFWCFCPLVEKGLTHGRQLGLTPLNDSTEPGKTRFGHCIMDLNILWRSVYGTNERDQSANTIDSWVCERMTCDGKGKGRHSEWLDELHDDISGVGGSGAESE
jgi:hypothetical protein